MTDQAVLQLSSSSSVRTSARIAEWGTMRWAGIQRLLMRQYYVYILGGERNGTLYTGVTSNLIKRVYEHKNSLADGFTNKYDIHRFVWYEVHESVEAAITREKQTKKWKRDWKLQLIEKSNPYWNDLYEDICH